MILFPTMKSYTNVLIEVADKSYGKLLAGSRDHCLSSVLASLLEAYWSAVG